MNQQAPQYFLPQHVYMCLSNEHLVFLDLKHDKYICLDGTQSVAVHSLLKNRPTDIQVQKNDPLAATFRLLIENGLVSMEPAAEKDISPAIIKHPSRDLMGYDVGKKPKIHFNHIFHFLLSCLISAVRLRLLSLEYIVRTMKRRKQLHRSAAKETSAENIHDTVEIFKSLRPLVFTAKDNCMFDALALMEFLNRFGIYPSWTFGVRMGPFVAHCWIQKGDIALNDSVDHIASFTPIMTI